MPPHNTPSRVLLDAPTVAELLDVSERMVRKLAEHGDIATVKVGRNLRFHIDDVTAYIDAHRRPSTPASPAAGGAA